MDVHFNSYKVRYDTLNKTFEPIVRSQIVKSFNIFINLDDLFHSLHRPLVNNEFQACGKDASIQLISNIFNLIAHYRWWSISQMHRDCKVCLFYTTTYRTFKNNIYLYEYRKKFIDINSDNNGLFYFINHAIKEALPFIPVIAKYIPNVYAIDSKYIEPSVLPLYLTQGGSESAWNILISRDPYDLQYSYRNRWSMISPKGDNTHVVSKTGIWNYINYKERVYKDQKDLNYPFSMYILARAIVGDKYRSIPRLRKIGWKTLFSFMDKVMKDNPDSSEQILMDKLLKILLDKGVTAEILSHNLNAINIDLQYQTLLNLDRTGIDMQLQDVPDYENLKELNRTKFSQYPLNLTFLCNEITNNKPKTPFG